MRDKETRSKRMRMDVKEFRSDPSEVLEWVACDGYQVEVTRNDYSQTLDRFTGRFERKTVAVVIPYARYLELIAIEAASKESSSAQGGEESPQIGFEELKRIKEEFAVKHS